MILRCTIILHEKEFFLYNISLDPQILISEQYIDIQGKHLSFYPSFLLYLCVQEIWKENHLRGGGNITICNPCVTIVVAIVLSCLLFQTRASQYH